MITDLGKQAIRDVYEKTFNQSEQGLNSPIASIPQNLISGQEAFGTLQHATPEVKAILGENPTSIDMIEAGLRTRTTRSVGEMEKYNIKVGDIVKHFGKSADGKIKNIKARVTAIQYKGTPEFESTWYKEGWTQEGIKAIQRYKDGAAAIEFEIIKDEVQITPVKNENVTSNVNKNEILSDEVKVTKEDSKKEIKPGVEELFESNPELANGVYEALGFKSKPDVILPIGTSGSGKSAFIKSLPQENLVIIEPDAMRVEFTGDINDKSKDKEIYEEAAKRAVQAIKQGKQVVFDTTNLTKDKRLPFIEAIKKAIPTANIQYKLMELNPELAKQRIKSDIAAGKNRANVPDSTIDRHAESYKQMLEDIKSEPISNFEITPQQKQQATFMFSEFLDVYLQDFNQVEKILKEEKIIDKKCS